MSSNIHSDILETNLARLNLAELMSVSAGGGQWSDIIRSFANANKLTVRHRSWLILSDNPFKETIALLNPLQRWTFGLKLNHRFCGALGDWIAINDMDDGLYLFHPLRRPHIPLPPVTTLPHHSTRFDRHNLHFVNKVILSSPQPSTGCVVVIIFGDGELAFCRFGDAKWTELEPDIGRERRYQDACFYNGELGCTNTDTDTSTDTNTGTDTAPREECLVVKIIKYGHGYGHGYVSDTSSAPPEECPCNLDGELVAVDSNEIVWAFGFGPGLVERRLVFMPPSGWDVHQFDMRYLMESMGQLLMVIRRRRVVFTRIGLFRRFVSWRNTYEFQVYQLKVNGGGWTQLESLGERVMFLGSTLSVLLPSEEIKEDFGSDCIYYAECEEKNPWEPMDIGTFWMADRRVIRLSDRDDDYYGVGCRSHFEPVVPLFFCMTDYNWGR